MGFAEIGLSVNSDLKVPLNHLIWLNDYKTYGQDSYVYGDKDIWNELLEQYQFMNDTSLNDDILDYANSKGKLGLALNGVQGLDFSLFANSIKTFDDLLANRDALHEVNISENSNFTVDRIYKNNYVTKKISDMATSSSISSNTVECKDFPYTGKRETSYTINFNTENKRILITSLGIKVVNTISGPEQTIETNIYGEEFLFKGGATLKGVSSISVNRIITGSIDITLSSSGGGDRAGDYGYTDYLYPFFEYKELD